MKTSRASRQGGQILILMALLTTTLVIMFGMVISIGHLVQAKINLQNAVDLAAMSGSSYQARYMNHMALVNYRLRQNYKFVLYDLYITQSRYNVGLKEELDSAGGTFDKIPRDKYTFGICQQAYGFRPDEGNVLEDPGQPTAENTDMCQNATGSCTGSGPSIECTGKTIPPIEPYTGPLVNPELIAINETIKNLGLQQQQICKTSGPENSDYFYYIMGKLGQRQHFQVQRMLEIAKSFDTDFGTGDEIQGSDSASANRAIYATFAANLISANHPNQAAGVKLEYLNPSETRAPRMGSVGTNPELVFGAADPPAEFTRYFSRNAVGFRILAVLFDFDGGCKTQSKTFTCPGPKCDKMTLIGLSRTRADNRGGLIDRGPGGWEGAPPLIPFNVVLRATIEKPKLLFWPSGLTPSISAIGAAKPFGSRIGPSQTQTYLETQGTEVEPTSPGLANMAFFPGDWGGADSNVIPGIGNKKVASKLRDLLSSTGAWPDGVGSGQNNRRPSMSNRSGTCIQNVNQFICLAQAPTLYESLFYATYPFPVDGPPGGHYVLPSLMEAFPQELRLGVVPGAYSGGATMPMNAPATPTKHGGVYDLPDRSDSSGGNALWHETVPIKGDAGLTGDLDHPVFFANPRSILSSWNPAVHVPDFASEWGDHGEGVGRMGYQIKLVSVYQICKEIQRGIQSSSGISLGKLGDYCKAPQMASGAIPSADSEILY